MPLTGAAKETITDCSACNLEIQTRATNAHVFVLRARVEVVNPHAPRVTQDGEEAPVPIFTPGYPD